MPRTLLRAPKTPQSAEQRAASARALKPEGGQTDRRSRSAAGGTGRHRGQRRSRGRRGAARGGQGSRCVRPAPGARPERREGWALWAAGGARAGAGALAPGRLRSPGTGQGWSSERGAVRPESGPRASGGRAGTEKRSFEKARRRRDLNLNVLIKLRRILLATRRVSAAWARHIVSRQRGSSDRPLGVLQGRQASGRARDRARPARVWEAPWTHAVPPDPARVTRVTVD